MFLLALVWCQCSHLYYAPQARLTVPCTLLCRWLQNIIAANAPRTLAHSPTHPNGWTRRTALVLECQQMQPTNLPMITCSVSASIHACSHGFVEV
jgi:hypothetical protein